MKFALICPNVPKLDGYHIAQVTEVIFGVADPFYWVECADNVTAEMWYFKDGQTIEIPVDNGLQSM
jgi:hypothetical protein